MSKKVFIQALSSLPALLVALPLFLPIGVIAESRIELVRPLTHDRIPSSFSSPDGIAAVHSGHGFVTVLDMGTQQVVGQFRTTMDVKELIVTIDQKRVLVAGQSQAEDEEPLFVAEFWDVESLTRDNELLVAPEEYGRVQMGDSAGWILFSCPSGLNVVCDMNLIPLLERNFPDSPKLPTLDHHRDRVLIQYPTQVDAWSLTDDTVTEFDDTGSMSNLFPGPERIVSGGAGRQCIYLPWPYSYFSYIFNWKTYLFPDGTELGGGTASGSGSSCYGGGEDGIVVSPSTEHAVVEFLSSGRIVEVDGGEILPVSTYGGVSENVFARDSSPVVFHAKSPFGVTSDDLKTMLAGNSVPLLHDFVLDYVWLGNRLAALCMDSWPAIVDINSFGINFLDQTGESLPYRSYLDSSLDGRILVQVTHNSLSFWDTRTGGILGVIELDSSNDDRPPFGFSSDGAQFWYYKPGTTYLDDAGQSRELRFVDAAQMPAGNLEVDRSIDLQGPGGAILDLAIGSSGSPLIGAINYGWVAHVVSFDPNTGAVNVTVDLRELDSQLTDERPSSADIQFSKATNTFHVMVNHDGRRWALFRGESDGNMNLTRLGGGSWSATMYFGHDESYYAVVPQSSGVATFFESSNDALIAELPWPDASGSSWLGRAKFISDPMHMVGGLQDVALYQIYSDALRRHAARQRTLGTNEAVLETAGGNSDNLFDVGDVVARRGEVSVGGGLRMFPALNGAFTQL